MYKTEDLIRAFEFDVDQIEKYMISHLPISDEDKLAEKDWYEGITEIMKSGKGMESGHLAEVQAIVVELQALHEKLLESDQNYSKVIEEGKQDLHKYLTLANKDSEFPIKEVQVCLNAIYGYLLLQMENKPISEDQKDTVEKFGAILAYLSFTYRGGKNLDT